MLQEIYPSILKLLNIYLFRLITASQTDSFATLTPVVDRIWSSSNSPLACSTMIERRRWNYRPLPYTNIDNLYLFKCKTTRYVSNAIGFLCMKCQQAQEEWKSEKLMNVRPHHFFKTCPDTGEILPWNS